MQEWVVLRHPELVLLYGLALLLCLMEKKWKASRGWLFYASCACAAAASAMLILQGADLREAAAYLTVFLLLMPGVRA